MPHNLHNMHETVNSGFALHAFAVNWRLVHDAHMNLRTIRKAKGLSAADLAELIGVDVSTVTRAETKHESAKLATYIRCADALGVSLSDVFAEDRSALEQQLIQSFRMIPAYRREQLLGLIRLAEVQLSE
jgi:transcriptional regulator with XRE-family HTH domain